MTASISIVTDARAAASEADALLIVGRQKRLLDTDVLALLPVMAPGVWEDMVKKGDAGDAGRSASTFTGTMPARLAACVLPEPCSRHNAPSRASSITGLVRSVPGSRIAVILAVDDPAHVFASVLAVARAWPQYDARSKSQDVKVAIGVVGAAIDPERLRIAADAVRFAARLADLPTNQLGTNAFVEAAKQVVAKVPGVRVTVISGEQLAQEGLGGLYAVGKAALQPPALVVLDAEGEGERVGWVGKGIVYDTGGLSIKDKNGMPGMKGDMAGASAVLCAFAAARSLGMTRPLTAVLCIAENAIGPNATRPDDVIRMYSGKTVDVNNTDAEGRLVLADGLAWLIKNRNVREIVDVATLTGAQSVATGKRHAGVYANNEDIEGRAIEAGRRSGDLCFPLLFAPELFRSEFQSSVADMKNSVKDRNNAQSSCAGEFIRMNMDAWDGAWVHVDMAGPAKNAGGRHTGFGVGLLLAMVGLF